MNEPTVQELLALAGNLAPGELAQIIDQLTPAVAARLIEEMGVGGVSEGLAESPLEQANRLMEDFASRPHLTYLSERIAQAVKDVESGIDRKLIVEMPPRSGKSTLATQISAAWALTRNPNWHMVLTSYSGPLATSWGRQVRRWTSEGKLGSHLRIAPDAGAATDWDTVDGGKFISRSIGGGITGYGAKMLIIDDPHKDFADAHSKTSRDAVWDWWLSTASIRLNPPSLVIVIMTRWHEDDLVGRLLSKDYEGDPSDWERISFPAIAEIDDVLGRSPGDPLLSPLIEETREDALTRWEKIKRSVGSYVWSALFQQRPAPAEGSVFTMDWFRFWTTNPDDVSYTPSGEPDPKGQTVLIDPAELSSGRWVDSWDMTFTGSNDGDYVVGQRWVRHGANRYLIAQQRGHWSFSESLAAMRRWAEPSSELSPYGDNVHERLVEHAANGPAIIDTLQAEISGIKPIKARNSKEARARAISPEIESGNVFLPHPNMPGCGWVRDLLSEIRNFPHDAHDDQVDALTQALSGLRTSGHGGISIPGRGGASLPGGYRVSSGLTSRRRV